MTREQAEKALKAWKDIFLWKQLRNERWVAYYFLWNTDYFMYTNPGFALLYLDADGEPAEKWFKAGEDFGESLAKANQEVDEDINRIRRFYDHFLGLKKKKVSNG
jgi:hypothetical protein